MYRDSGQSVVPGAVGRGGLKSSRMVPLRPSTLTLFDTKSFHFGTLCSILGQRLNISTGCLPCHVWYFDAIYLQVSSSFNFITKGYDEVSQGRISGMPGTVF